MSLLLAMAVAIAIDPAQAESGPAVPVPQSEIEKVLPKPQPRMSYDPHIIQVGSCMWDHLDPDVKAKLVAKSAQAPPFVVVWAAHMNNELPIYPAMKLCDPNFWRHKNESIVAWQSGIVKQLSLLRLQSDHIDQKKLDSVWNADSSLRGGMQQLMNSLKVLVHDRTARADESDDKARATENLKQCLSEALPKLDLTLGSTIEPGSAQAAAGSYWMARALEAEFIEPLTVAPAN